MKCLVWKIDVGGYPVDIESEDKIDAIEASTRAIEFLHSNHIDYKIGPIMFAASGEKNIAVKADLVLANAGRFSQCEKLRNLIREYKEKMKNKPSG